MLAGLLAETTTMPRDTAIIVAVITVIGSIICAAIARVHKVNRREHRDSMSTLEVLVQGQGEIKADIKDARADIHELRDAGHLMNTRITHLEEKTL